MTTQTLTEKLRILADAAEAGETTMHISSYDISGIHPIGTAILYISRLDTISRIPKPKEQIKVGERWINAPLREIPKPSKKLWFVDSWGDVNSWSLLLRLRADCALDVCTSNLMIA